MKKYQLLTASFCCFFMAILSPFLSLAQLCTGSLGDPVVNITFGSGSNPGPPLVSNLTSLTFVDHDCPNDGYYSVRNGSSSCFGSTWHSITADHTGDPGGYFMLVNASYDPSDFYVGKVDGLCPNTTYQFASWIMNVVSNNQSIEPNLTFNIEKPDGTVLKTFNTGNISAEGCAEWRQYGFFFTNGSDNSSVILRIRNNAPGGIGNDLALDDITFSPCGPQVKATISGSDKDSGSVCEGNTVPIKLSAQVLSGYINPAYQWQVNQNGTNWVDVPGATSMEFSTTQTIAGLYSYRLSVAESGNLGIASCRVNSNVVGIYVRKKPDIRFTSGIPACEGAMAVIQAEVNFYSASGFVATWIPPDPLITGNTSLRPGDSANTGIIKYTIPNASQLASGYYNLKVANAYGCSKADSTRLVLQSKPAADFTVNGSTCEKTPVAFIGTASIQSPNTISSYYWDFGNGDSTNTQSPGTMFNSPGNYLVHYLARASNGCNSDTVKKTIIVHTSPVADFILPEVCLADPYAEFLDQSSGSAGSNSMQYQWQFGDPAASGGNPNTSTAKDPRHRYSSVGQYNVSLQVVSQEGCIADTIKTFTVNGSVPKSIFSMNGTGLRCSNDSILLMNQSTVDFGQITRVVIYWDYDRDPTDQTIDEDPADGKAYSHQYANTPIGGSEYRIRYIVYSGVSCLNESEQLVSISKSPEIVFKALAPVCQELAPFTIIQATETSGIQGTGIYSGTAINSSGLFTPRDAPAGNNPISYTFTSSAGCETTSKQDIVVHATPVINAGPDRIMLKDGQITLQATAKGESLQYNWSPSVSIVDPAVLQAVAKPATETLYTLTATSGPGCTSTDQVLVKVVETIAIPNAFTPNGDGKNDTWQIPYIDSYPGMEVQVYNRYGQLVYRSQNGVVNWDGTINGRPQDAGTYVYVFDRKQFGGIAKGTILLIR